MYPEKKEDIVLGSFFRKLDKTQWELKAAVPLFLHPKKTICLGNPQDLDLEVQFRENHFRCMNPNQTFRSFLFAKSKELYTEMPNSDIRILCTVHCGRNVSKPRTPTEFEGKGLKLWCDITRYYSPTKNKSKYQDFRLSAQYGKYNSNLFLFHAPLGSFSLKNDALPLNSLFWSPPTAVHRFDACYMSVPGLYISWHTQTKQPVILQHPGECWECWFQSDYTIVKKNTAMPICFTMCM